MRSRFVLLGLAVAIGLGACGDDTPYVPKDGGGPPPGATFTDFVIDLVNNHTTDPTPAPYSDFMAQPDPDGDNNNTAAYDSLFH